MSRVDTTDAGIIETTIMDQKSSDLLSARPTPNITTVAAAFAQALALHQAGRLTDAEKMYRQILAAQPTHFDSLHLLGVIFCSAGTPRPLFGKSTQPSRSSRDIFWR